MKIFRRSTLLPDLHVEDGGFQALLGKALCFKRSQAYLKKSEPSI